MRLAIDETERRRALQQEYNSANGITPETIRKTIRAGIESEAAKRRQTAAKAKDESETTYITIEYVEEIEREMLTAAENLEFERAAQLRDRALQLKENIGKPLAEVEFEEPASGAGSRGQRRGRIDAAHQRLPGGRAGSGIDRK